MSQVSLYDIAVPTFTTTLNAMSTWLDRGEAYAAEKKFDVANLLDARLAPDMFSLRNQTQMATAFAKNAMCRLAGQTPPDFPDAERTLADVRARIARTLTIIQGIKPADFDAAPTREISVQTGPNTHRTLSGTDYLLRFSLPQFYFHSTAAYALLRHNGVTLGKMDFMGA
jgi:hypothetical protein